MAVGWFEVNVQDMDSATDFYQTAFQVTLQDVSDVTDESRSRSFPMMERADSANGALVKSDLMGPARGGTIVYFEVEDCALEERRALVAGGTVVDRRSPSVPMATCPSVRTRRGISSACIPWWSWSSQ